MANFAWPAAKNHFLGNFIIFLGDIWCQHWRTYGVVPVCHGIPKIQRTKAHPGIGDRACRRLRSGPRLAPGGSPHADADADAPKALTSPTSGSLRADAASVRPSPNSHSSVLASHPAAPPTGSPPPTARSSRRAPGLPACCCSAAGASLLPCHSSSHLPRRCRRPATAACFPCRPGCHGVSAHAIIASI